MPLNTQITQTTTLTTTSSGKHLTTEGPFNLDTDLLCNPVRLSAFIDLDRLVLELSSLSNTKTEPAQPLTDSKDSEKNNHSTTSFTNEQCNYLVSQFESFAKEFQKKELFDVNSSINSGVSTLNRNTDTSTLTSTSTKTSANSYSNNTTPRKTKTLYTNTVFKHDYDQKLTAMQHLLTDGSNNNNNNTHENGLISKIVDHKNCTKTNFIETNILLNDKSIDDIMLGAKVIFSLSLNCQIV